MNAIDLNHFTLRTPKLEETRRFFEDIVGLRAGNRPDFKFDGYWMYSAANLPVLHMMALDTGDAELVRYLGDRVSSSGSGVVDHISFNCEGLPGFEERLKKAGYPYSPRTVPGEGLHQVFVQEPNGITIEFMFKQCETASWLSDASGVAVGDAL
jgi:catechol 2,3-dioxygenase-like lactoylglutathione lyase family enzyme